MQAIIAKQQELDMRKQEDLRLIADKHAQLKHEAKQLEARLEHQKQEDARDVAEKNDQLREETERLQAEWAKFNARKISYKELQEENGMLKRDVGNMEISRRRMELDGELLRRAQESLDRRGKELGERFLKDNVKWIGASLTANNFIACKQRLQAVIEWCRGIGLSIPEQEEAGLLANLKAEFERLVRAAVEREEQARIKAQIREEQALQKEVDRELKQWERERAAIQAALDQALADAKNQHTAEVERLQARLAEAEAKAQKAISQAQLTKAGNVYVISNIGSFGEGVFKIGMTRRLEPLDRVRELGDASVPFPFDVHMMIASQDAPALETALHQTFHKSRMNKVNPRKEFFRVDLAEITRIVEKNHGEVQHTADAEALEYRQSLTISEDDQEYIENVYQEMEKTTQTPLEED
jgi:hypothetical protein